MSVERPIDERSPMEIDDHPSLDAWMALPIADIEREIAPRGIAALVTLDGTRRWAYLHHPETRTDHGLYARVLSEATLSLIDRIFALGVQTIVVPALYPENFERGEAWLRTAIGPEGMEIVACDRHLSAYRAWGARVRIGGTFHQAQPWAVEALEAINRRLSEATPSGRRLLIWECDAGCVVTAALMAAHRIGPDPSAVRKVFHPDGPEQVDFIIQAGWACTLQIPPLLTRTSHFYFITNLTLDLDDAQLRAILYDYAFQRHVAPEDNMVYSDEMLSAYRRIYLERAPRVLGVGELAPGGVWVLRDGMDPSAAG
jgi:hypothetical protein